MISRPQTFTELPLNIVGSSIFGRYPKISSEKTYNMFVSDNFLVPYAGYEIAIPASTFGGGKTGRAAHTSIKLNRLVTVIDSNVYLCQITFDQIKAEVVFSQAVKIGSLQTSTGVVYVAENNKPQILFSDNTALYIYDQTLTPNFQVVPTNFIPGFIDFHDTYFLCAASADGFYAPPANNTWRLSGQNDGTVWADDAASIGLLQTKPDNTQAVVRIPGKGNMVLVMGKTVGEPWFDVGYQLFPYQRNTSSNIDYGCLNPASVAALDEIVVWLASNEKSGAIIMFSDGGEPQQITTDGIDYLMSNFQNPADCQGFLYRQDGHLFYHINFYTDNVSLFYDFNTKKFYNACDHRGNYFIASSLAFFNNQYYFVSRNNGNLYAFHTIFTTQDGNEMQRIRVCKNARKVQQEYFICNDIGFTIETGETDYLPQNVGDIYLITEDGNKYITDGDFNILATEDDKILITQDGNTYVSENADVANFDYLISEQADILQTLPRVDLSISIDGGQHFSSYDSVELPPLGFRKFKCAWWQLGAANDMVCQFRFWGMGRFVVTDGVMNIRQ